MQEQQPSPYYATVLSILQTARARRILDAPCGSGWLGRSLKKGGNDTITDGLGLWQFPSDEDGYHEVWEHDLEEPIPDRLKDYDAVVCGEAIHLLTSPGLLLKSFHRCLRPGGKIIITTPNTWYFRSRVQFLLRGFHSGFRPMIGKKRGEYITYFPWSFTQLHLLLTHHSFGDIRIHDVDEPKPKRLVEHLLALPSRAYLSHRLRESRTDDEKNYWRQAGSKQSLHGRWLVVSATKLEYRAGDPPESGGSQADVAMSQTGMVSR